MMTSGRKRRMVQTTSDEDFVVSPLGQRLGGCLGVAEVDGAAEKLLRAVDASRGQQFLGADQSEQVALFRADEVLAAFAAGERKVAGAHVTAAGQIGKHGRVLVVRMRGDHQRATQNI